jgi:hypothetical protein
MEPISLQLINPNCKPGHAHACTFPRSVEQHAQQTKVISYYSSEWASLFPTFSTAKKNGCASKL